MCLISAKYISLIYYHLDNDFNNSLHSIFDISLLVYLMIIGKIFETPYEYISYPLLIHSKVLANTSNIFLLAYLMFLDSILNNL